MTGSRWAVPVFCGVVVAVVTVLCQLLAHPSPFHPSRLLSVAATDPLAAYLAERDPSFVFTTPADHYDGIYYVAVALDPFATGQPHDLIDLAAYRYGHPLHGWLGGLLSLGQPGALPWVFWALSIAWMVAAAVLMSLLARRLGGSPWLGLLVCFTPGLLFSASTALTEPGQVALICALLLAWHREQRNWALIAGLGVAVCLMKEQLVLVPVALGMAELLRWWRTRSIDWRPVPALLAGPLALAAWLLYVRSRFTAEQSTYDDGNVGSPVAGWLETFGLANQLRAGDFLASQIGSTAVPGLLAIAAVLVVASVIGLVQRSPLGFVVLLQTVLVSTLGWRTLLYPHEMFRIPSVALCLAVLLLTLAATRNAARWSRTVEKSTMHDHRGG
ncbi:MAG: hypothetical protein Q4D96_08510 [Propionibacteriaceae bacterium]|nr:hypothetical protein [Propionibacteriaceae bacterium]